MRVSLIQFLATSIVALSSCASTIGFAQKKPASKQDSSVLKQRITLLFKIDSTHKAYSLRRMVLLKQIENLQGMEAHFATSVLPLWDK